MIQQKPTEILLKEKEGKTRIRNNERCNVIISIEILETLWNMMKKVKDERSDAYFNRIFTYIIETEKNKRWGRKN